MKNKQIGFLTYDLQQFTEDCLSRISQAIAPMHLKAYPIIYHPYQAKSRVAYLPTLQKGKHFGVNVVGSTPEGFASNINWLAAWRCAKESDVIVLVGLLGGTALLTGFLAIILKRKLISVNQTLPVYWEQKRRWWIRWLKKWLLNRCAYHVYQSPATKEVLLSVYRVNEKSLFFAPFEAGASLFKKIVEQQHNHENKSRLKLNLTDEVIFLFVGNLHPFKGVFDIIKAAARIPKGSRFVCVFAGPEESRNKQGGTIDLYMKMAREINVADRIIFLGNVTRDNLAAMYLAADVVLLPTHKDSFGKVLVEGALTAKPLITSTACGAADAIVIDGDNGFIIQPGDITSLAHAMNQLLDTNLRNTMGARSKEIVNDFCNSERETKGFVDAIMFAVTQINNESR